MSWPSPVEALAYLVAGGVLGAAYFWALHRTVRLLASHVGRVHVIALYAARIAVAVAAFWLAAQQGAWALVLVFAGFLLARVIVQRRVATG